MKYILALDQGTTSSRAILFDESGEVRRVAQREFRQIFPQPGWVEHDAREIAATQLDVAREVIAKTPDAEIAAIGITNQRETTIVWDRKSGEPIANAIVWQDRRTANICAALREQGFEDLIRERTGLVLDPYFSGTKIRWLLDEVPAADERAERGELAFGTVDSWLIWQLTGGTHVTDVSNASRTLLFDIRRGQWDDELLEIFRIPRSVLPDVRPSSGIVGKTVATSGLPQGIPIAGIAGDQQAALFGQRCTAAGMAKNTYGTGSFVVMNTGSEPVSAKRGLLATIAWQLPNTPLRYALEGSIFITGAAVQWLRDGLGVIESAGEIESLAASVPDSGGLFFVPAFTGLGTPHWDPHARGAILGITRGATSAHLARATLESIAFQTADVLEAMREESGIELKELRVDGGASKNDLLMQIQADIAGIPVVRTAIAETTALGAAYLAGLAVGFWKTEQEIDAQWKVDRVFEPKMDARHRAAMMDEWKRAVERAKNWAS